MWQEHESETKREREKGERGRKVFESWFALRCSSLCAGFAGIAGTFYHGKAENN